MTLGSDARAVVIPSGAMPALSGVQTRDFNSIVSMSLHLAIGNNPAGDGMQPGLCAKTAVVTGASKGIGRAIAEALAVQGCNPHVSYNNDHRVVAISPAAVETERLVTSMKTRAKKV